MSIINKIRQQVLDRDYYLSSHAEDEMVDDNLERNDVENASLTGRIDKKLTEDIRGTRYRVEGFALDGRTIHVLCRFRENGAMIKSLYTLYRKTYELRVLRWSND